MAVQQNAKGEPTQPYNVGKEKRHISAHTLAGEAPKTAVGRGASGLHAVGLPL